MICKMQKRLTMSDHEVTDVASERKSPSECLKIMCAEILSEKQLSHCLQSLTVAGGCLGENPRL